MNTIFQPISPLWEAFPTSKPQTTEAAASGSSIFADIFNTMVDNVRETEDVVAKNEYLLSTGQLDNPAEGRRGHESADPAAGQGAECVQ